MRFFASTAVAALLIFCLGSSASAAVRVLDERNGKLEVAVDLDDRSLHELNASGLPELRYERFFVAVPAGATVRVRMEEGTSVDRRGGLPSVRPVEPGTSAAVEGWRDGFFPEQPYRVSNPFMYRKTRVVAVDCFASQVDYDRDTERRWSDYRLIVEYPPMRKSRPANTADPLVSRLVINSKYLPSPAAPTARAAGPVPDPQFSRSPNWIKIRITSPGMYAITGADLAGAGVNVGLIDSDTFRLFTLGGEKLSMRLNQGTPTWAPGTWMTECAIAVEDGDDMDFGSADRVMFYGLPVEHFDDLYAPGSARDAFRKHTHAQENVYYLTWDEVVSFPGDPIRMAQSGAPPIAAPDLTTFEHRMHFEENRVEDYAFGDDGWMWLDIPAGTGPLTRILPSFTARDIDLSQPQTFRTRAVAPYPGFEFDNRHRAVYYMNGTQIGQQLWTTPIGGRYDNGVDVAITGSLLQNGDNTVWLNVPRDSNPEDFMYFSHYDVFYHRFLRPFNDALRFSSPDTTGTVNFSISGFGGAGALYVFDVTHQFAPRMLTGFTVSGSGPRDIRFSSPISGRHRYYWSGTGSAMKTPVMESYFPRDLRNVTLSEAPHMLIVTHEDFVASARQLRSFRLSRLPFYSNPVIEVVETEEIFDNFSGGLPDPMALRNYFKFLYDNFTDNGSPLLTFVLLLGDANADVKNYKTTQEDFVTTNLNLRPRSLDSYATDDWFVALDDTDTLSSVFIDVSVGRLPAASPAEAQFLVDRVITYETQRDFDPWRDRIVLLADDEQAPSTGDQPFFVNQSEEIANSFLGTFLNPQKIYLTEFQAIQGIKPASRLTFLNAWNDGTLLINYIGHGSSVQMADEQVFLASDVGNLTNGLRLPLFMAFSCTIGAFANAQAKSLSERLLLREGGGVIGTVTASQLTFINPNRSFMLNVFAEMFPNDPGLAEPLGVGVMNAKLATMSVFAPNFTYDENLQKYNLLGDPTLRLLIPQREVRLLPSDVDTLVTGKRQTIRGMVLDDQGLVDAGFDGRVHLLLREPDDISGYTREEDGYHIAYRYSGGTVYRGTADATAGEFEFSVQIPRFAGFGRNALALAYAEDGTADAITKNHDVVFTQPSAGDSTALQPVDGKPRVQMGFTGGLTTVKPGAVLRAAVRDGDGVNILSTTPEGKLALVFDDTNLPVNVTDFFSFDHGGVDTAGTLLFPLSSMAVGPHRAVLKVADSFGQTQLDTIQFTVTDALDYSAEVVFNYPNPFETTTYFLLGLTDPAEVRLDIYTATGRRIRTLTANKSAGEAWILWDGRDATGDDIANGTYLYVANVSFMGLDRPPVVLRGKVVKMR
jgi:hypothetical protein